MSSRSEEILTAIVDGEMTEIEPRCRKEQFLKAIANGDATNLPNPTCREEELLLQIAEKGVGGGGTTNIPEDLTTELEAQDTAITDLENMVDNLPKTKTVVKKTELEDGSFCLSVSLSEV